MLRAILMAMVFLLPCTLAGGGGKDKDEPKSKASIELDALKKQLKDRQKELAEAFRRADTEKEREQIRDQFFDLVPEFADKFVQFAQKHPKDLVAEEALIFFCEDSEGEGPKFESAMAKVLGALSKINPASPKLGTLCFRLDVTSSPALAQVMRDILDKTPLAEVKTLVSLSLGKNLRGQYEKAWQEKDAKAAQLGDEAEAVLTKAEKTAGDLQSEFQDALFMLKNLSLGKVAPEIDGEDIDGKKFKLSDYRGKVVLLDFWGHW